MKKFKLIIFGVIFIAPFCLFMVIFHINNENDYKINKKTQNEYILKYDPEILELWERGFENNDKAIKFKEIQLWRSILIKNYNYNHIELDSLSYNEKQSYAILELSKRELKQIDSITLELEKNLNKRLKLYIDGKGNNMEKYKR